MFDAELYVLYRALQTFDDREEQDCRCAFFSDPAAVLGRVASDRLGPGQRPAVAAIELCDSLMNRGNPFTVRWTPAHLEVEGNEAADLRAKGAVRFTPSIGPT